MQPLIDSAQAPDGRRPGEDDGENAPATPPPAALVRLRALAAHRWFWPAALLLGYLGQTAFRLVLSVHNYFPSVHADEDSYLVIARVLAGRPTTEMPVGVVIPGGYPLLISPALRIAENPATAYHLIMGINAVLNALVFPLVFLAARRLGLSRPHAYLSATAVALVPPVVFYSQFVMSDTVLPVLLLAWLVTMHGWLSPGSTRRRSLYAAGTGLAAGYAMATHDRGGVVVALTALVLVVVLAFGWAPRLSALAGIGALGVSVLGAKLLAGFVENQFKDVPPSTVGNKVFENLENSKYIGTIIARTFGQLWYFMTSTYGFGAVAFVLCVVAVFRRGFSVAERVVAFCMIAMLFGTALASAAGLADTDRVDNWVYARYCAVLVPLFLVVGLAALFRAGTRSLLRLALVGVVVIGVIQVSVTAYAGSALKEWALPWTVPDAMFLASTWDNLHMGRTTVGALAVLAACLLLRVAGGRRVVAAVVGCVTLFAAYATVAITDNIAEPHARTRTYEAVGLAKEAGLRKGDSVVLDWDFDWGARMALAYEVYWGRVWTDNVKAGNTPPEKATAVLLSAVKGAAPEASWPKPQPGWHVAKYSKDHGWVLWRKG
ncbi:phospholipid carrier-dependent glycosyltransferase [Streptomyces sp. NRRL S-350]|uniref:phospholipid carrier-dependent glycosyltransferase n=1 Tax=Streptomyces sp. NRRL S-350 TaxID=1463902 RepID=UPI0004BEE786|nr:phospholipid carrier-dependent glycosyltransferase [Streptomyces sp. NRRL S-350]